MKKLVIVLATCMLATAVSCGGAHTFLTIPGVVPPKIDAATLACSFEPAAGSSGFKVEGALEVTIQKALFTDLTVLAGVQVENNLNTGVTTDATGKTFSGKERDTIVLNEADVTYTDEAGASLASATLVANTTIKQGAISVVVLNLVNKQLQDALLARHTNFLMKAQITLLGSTAAGSSVSSDPFTYPVEIRYDAVPDGAGLDGGTTLPDGSLPCE